MNTTPGPTSTHLLTPMAQLHTHPLTLALSTASNQDLRRDGECGANEDFDVYYTMPFFIIYELIVSRQNSHLEVKTFAIALCRWCLMHNKSSFHRCVVLMTLGIANPSLT
ncbi:hypothetical protein Pelo_2958 [Pelomyxa schiedti]|nr:hypothetical protein Pelo_2958 [Pelomyxa schiedti]